ncbi:MAG: DUF1648 domain-containing protein, partial [Bacteroidia bacterium]|nr:DUF1648 domain-containing protein [Bacteroidia bacterium]
PKIKVPYEQLDIFVELLNITLLLLIWGYTLTHYFDLPETIPVHFNAEGVADDYGNKAVIWILPAIATFLYFTMFLLNRFPHIHNYMVNITEENALKNYRLSTRVLRYVNLYCLLLFALLVYDMFNMSQGGEAKILSPEFILVSIAAPIGLVAYAIYQQKRINR